ncbi:vesicle transport through interaction with t-SNAREs homolog 1B [Adelges cooleyi]|uniref:vesicle transport through interaction with t-SNAREs homolog 1B n=1 Tax=Adelges cooleyi TaxID=133065 RepID=UPI00217F937D|nr:vesicle transport through interaction with t-SNAREs homolog 1B [Adelges cooleyi]XP_050423555.1 vesicle transport through interaction with t-SNAREs homolog 1B [Adelges cooleyi]
MDVFEENQQVLMRTNDRLIGIKSVALETEEIGTAIVQELGEQRHTLSGARDRLDNIENSRQSSHRYISAINRHVFQDKLLLILIIIVESCSLIGLIYLKFIK